MLDKLQELKRQSEESNERLSNLVISEKSTNGMVEIAMNGQRELKSLTIHGELSEIDKEELEDSLHNTISAVLLRVNKANEDEVMSSAMSIFPGM